LSVTRALRRGLVLIVGVALMLGGVVLLVLPGPGVLVIFAGLGLLATEFTWAARLLRWAKTRGKQLIARARARFRRRRPVDARPDQPHR
jgi:uncharacterized protein (TIGR02611 family)